MTRFLMFLLGVLCVLSADVGLAQSYRCDWGVNGIGGGEMSSSAYKCGATAGQTAAGFITSSSLWALIGYWLPGQVRIRDVGAVRVLAPKDTVDTGAVVVPAALVQNFGTLTETFPVRFDIGSFYTSETSMTLASGAIDTVRFEPWQVSQLGTHVVRCSTMLAGDANNGNDLATDTVIVLPYEGVAEANRELPVRFALDGCRPNPFTGSTVIHFAVPRQTHAVLSIYSATGALVRALVNSSLTPAYYTLRWDGRNGQGRALPNGTYFYRLEAGEFRAVRRALMVR
ncbi:MAG: hypothetical protein NTX53_18005 [candidate division WOR-3 bacterium]|nr:hypothetical protein [candidate division WOR-3 bacterium]